MKRKTKLIKNKKGKIISFRAKNKLKKPVRVQFYKLEKRKQQEFKVGPFTRWVISYFWVFGIFIFILVIYTAYLDYGFQPEDEVCTYTMSEEESFLCSRWRDKTEQEKKLDECRELLK